MRAPTTAGKVLSGEELKKAAEFGRYNDVDGDGIPYRTLPGAHPTLGAYFTRGTSRDRFARYTEEGLPYVDNMERLVAKFETARSLLPRPVLKPAAKPTRVGVLHYGSTAAGDGRGPGVAGGRGHPCRHPAHPRVSDALEVAGVHPRATTRMFVVEQNRDAQMRAADLDRSRGSRPTRCTSDPALQRDADLRPFHCPGNRGATARAGCGPTVGAAE